jgi:hypothetical protein
MWRHARALQRDDPGRYPIQLIICPRLTFPERTAVARTCLYAGVTLADAQRRCAVADDTVEVVAEPARSRLYPGVEVGVGAGVRLGVRCGV